MGRKKLRLKGLRTLRLNGGRVVVVVILVGKRKVNRRGRIPIQRGRGEVMGVGELDDFK